MGTGVSIYQGQQAQQATERAAKYGRQQSDLQAARERRDAVRQARFALATSKQSAANQGAENSSAAMGGFGSIQSQLGSNLSFLDQYKAFGDQAANAIADAQQAQYYASVGSSVANLAMQGMGAFGGSTTKSVTKGATDIGKSFPGPVRKNG